MHEVDVATIGCDRPDRPEAFEGVVYVPCPGDSKVVRLDSEGARAGDDIALPDGGDPSLVLDDGQLLINVPGAEHGVAIAADGSVSTIVRLDDSLPAVSGDPAAAPSVPAGTVDDVANDDAGPPTVPPPPRPRPRRRPAGAGTPSATRRTTRRSSRRTRPPHPAPHPAPPTARPPGRPARRCRPVARPGSPATAPRAARPATRVTGRPRAPRPHRRVNHCPLPSA